MFILIILDFFFIVRNSKQTKLSSVMLRCLKLRFNLGSGSEVDSFEEFFARSLHIS
jgi:hypothetical protein